MLQPRRTLGFARLVALTFFCVAGGAYGFEDAVGAAGPAVALAALIAVPWLWSFPTALMTAELSAAMPEDGGYVVWVTRAFGRFWGFQEGWWSWLCSFADNALYPVMFVDYLSYLRGDIAPAERWAIGAALVALTTWLNIRGTQLVGASLVVFTAIVLAPFAAMVALGAPHVDMTAWLAGGGKGDWALLLSVVLWNTSGWDNAGTLAGEVEKPGRNYPAAMAAAVVLVTIAYLLPVAVGVGVDSNWQAWEEGYFPKVAAAIGGPWLGGALAAAALVSAAGLLSALLCTSSRVPYAMAARGMLPASLERLHPQYATPWVSIVVNALGVAVLIPFSFQDLVQVDMFLYALALILEFAALVWLRLKAPEMPRPYRVPGGTAGAVALSVPPVVLCVLSMSLADGATVWVSVAGIVLGLAAYRIWNRSKNQTAASIAG
ncbi:MAG TPA: APC family permease [Candidatus Binatia bacterium]|jgi:amino acid transporter